MQRKILAKLTSKYQVTLPKAVRQILHLGSKDQIMSECIGNDHNRLSQSLAVRYGHREFNGCRSSNKIHY